MRRIIMTVALGVLVLTGAGCAEQERSTFLMGISTAEELVGDYDALTGPNFSTISLNEDGSYASFLNERPFDSGSWALTSSGLELDSEADFDITFDTVVFDEGLLFLMNADEEHQWEPIE